MEPRSSRVAALATEPFVLLALVHLTVLGWRLPLFDHLPGWMFDTHPKPLAVAWLAGAAAAALAGAAGCLVWRTRPRRAITALVACGFLFQHAVAFSEGRGLDGMRERIVRSGHAEFAEIAVAQRRAWFVATRYEEKVQAGQLGHYAHSKPPGTLLTYVATERIAHRLAPADSADGRLAALRTVAAVAWPLLCYLALVPLYGVAFAWTGDRDTALLACGLYSLAPSVTLITLHTDQFLFPTLALGCVWIATGRTRRRLALAAAAGLALWVAGFFTFALVLVTPLVIVSLAEGHTGATARGGAGAWLAGAVQAVVGVGVGIAVGWLAFRLVLHYDVAARFADARLSNAAWKGWTGSAFETLYFGWLNLLEFAVWVGVPLALLTAGRMRRAVQEAAALQHAQLALPALATAGVFVFLMFFGQNKGETARLWLFMVPFCCVLAADELRVRWRGWPRAAIPAVAMLQWLTIVLTKAGQDFF